jgi:hypothetical protein
MQQHLSRLDQAHLIAGHAVSYATAYLDGRHSAQQLADNAARLFLDLGLIETQETISFLVPVKLLVTTMMQTARRKIPDAAQTDARAERWHAVLASLVELVIHESRQLAKGSS